MPYPSKSEAIRIGQAFELKDAMFTFATCSLLTFKLILDNESSCVEIKHPGLLLTDWVHIAHAAKFSNWPSCSLPSRTKLCMLPDLLLVKIEHRY